MKPKQHNYLLLSVVALFYGAMVCTVMFKIPSITNNIITLFQTDATSASLLMSIFTFVSCIFAFPCAYLIKKFGAKQMVLAGTVISIIGCAIGAFSICFKDVSFPMLLLSRGLEGICYIFASICMPVLIKNSVPAEKSGLALSIFTLFIPLGSLIANTFTPAIMGALGFTGTWIAYSIGLAVFAVLVAILFSSKSDSNEETELANEPTKNPGSAFSIAAFMISFGIFCFMQFAIITYFPKRLMAVTGMDISSAGFIGTLPTTIAFVFAILFGYLSDKHGTFKKVYLFALIIFIPGIFMMFAFDGPLIYVGYALSCVGLAAPAVNTVATFELFSKKNAAFGVALSMCVCSIFQSASPIVCQTILGNDFTGWFPLSILLAVMGCAAVVCAALCKSNPKPKK